jgi:hypothetical protein
MVLIMQSKTFLKHSFPNRNLGMRKMFWNLGTRKMSWNLGMRKMFWIFAE